MRKITSLTHAISGLIELVTSVVLYIMPSGRVACWSDYQLFGFSKVQWGEIHIPVGTLYSFPPISTLLSLATPSGWRPGKKTLKPGIDLVGKVWREWKTSMASD